ncbi:hypothetical protein H4R34_003868 [Dimargaris verticillata]|uniref:PHD-type domain-containing protein n=1 Tax=Dimargaris verticillata TaxID=2761393 RepID=A0A9W8B619_9FUNG|nr:hypothetical protein H4R34_003868 [Dimargaris verticillata]
MSDPLMEAVVRQVVAKILYVHSRYDRFRQGPLLVLCDLLVRYLQQLAIEAKHNAQTAGRTAVTFFDVLDVMEHADSSLAALQQWCTMANWGHQSKRYNDAMRDKQAWQACLEKYLPASSQQCPQAFSDDWLTLEYRECLPDAIRDDWAVIDSVQLPPYLDDIKDYSAASPPPLSPLSEPGPDDLHWGPATFDDSHQLFTTMARDFRAIYLDHVDARVHDAELHRQRSNIPTHLPPLPLPVQDAERPKLPTSPQPSFSLPPTDEDFVDIESAGSAPSPIPALEPLVPSDVVPPPPVTLPPPALDGNSYHSIKPFSDSAVATMIRDIQIPLGITVNATLAPAPPRIFPSHVSGGQVAGFKAVLDHHPSYPSALISDSLCQDGTSTTNERTDGTSWLSLLVPAATLFGSPETAPGPPVALDHTAYPIHALVKTIATRQRHMPSLSLSRKSSLHQPVPTSETPINGTPYNPSYISGIPPSVPPTTGHARSQKLKIVGHSDATTPVFSTVGLPPTLANRLSTPRSIAIPSSLLQQGNTPLATTTAAATTSASRPPAGPSSRTPSLSTPSDHRSTAYRDTSYHTPTLKLSHRSPRMQSPLAHTIDDARSPSPNSTTSATKIKIKFSGLPKPRAATPKPTTPLSPLYNPRQPSAAMDDPDDLPPYATPQPKKRRKSSLSTPAPPTTSARLSPGPTDPNTTLAAAPPPHTRPDRTLPSPMHVLPSMPPLLPPASAPLIGAAVPPPGANIPPADLNATDIIHCVCATPFWDDSSFMISCDNCQQWFHGRCVGVVPGQDPETWLCPRCRH